MAVSVANVYSHICRELLEPGGPQSGIVEQADIISYIEETLTEFVRTSGVFAELFCLPIVAGTSVYDEPAHSVGAQIAWINTENALDSSGYIWDQTDSMWQLEPRGTPNEWREDNVGVLRVQVRPTPLSSGRAVQCSAGGGFYGTLSATSSAVDFDITMGVVAGPLYGLIASADEGDAFLTCPGGMFGTISDLCGMWGNFSATTYIDKSIKIERLTDYCDAIVNSMEFFIVAGTLGRIYSVDGELKNKALSDFWWSVYREGIKYMRMIADMQQFMSEPNRKGR